MKYFTCPLSTDLKFLKILLVYIKKEKIACTMFNISSFFFFIGVYIRRRKIRVNQTSYRFLVRSFFLSLIRISGTSSLESTRISLENKR